MLSQLSITANPIDLLQRQISHVTTCAFSRDHEYITPSVKIFLILLILAEIWIRRGYSSECQNCSSAYDLNIEFEYEDASVLHASV